MYIVQTEENFIRETCPTEDGAGKSENGVWKSLI